MDTIICDPGGPNIDENNKVYFNTRQTPCVVNTGIWKIPNGIATNAIEVVRPGESLFIVSGIGTAFLMEGGSIDF